MTNSDVDDLADLQAYTRANCTEAARHPLICRRVTDLAVIELEKNPQISSSLLANKLRYQYEVTYIAKKGIQRSLDLRKLTAPNIAPPSFIIETIIIDVIVSVVAKLIADWVIKWWYKHHPSTGIDTVEADTALMTLYTALSNAATADLNVANES